MLRADRVVRLQVRLLIGSRRSAPRAAAAVAAATVAAAIAVSGSLRGLGCGVGCLWGRGGGVSSWSLSRRGLSLCCGRSSGGLGGGGRGRATGRR
jgi:hypothetical protein